MPHPLLVTDEPRAIPVWAVSENSFAELAGRLPEPARAFAAAQQFEAKPGNHCILPRPDGALEGVLFGIDPPSAKRPDPFLVGKLPTVLPDGSYRFEGTSFDPTLATLAWLLGSYRFERYREPAKRLARLVPPEGVAVDEVARIAEAVAFGRDLVNTPANDLGPEEIEGAARALAAKHGATIEATVGEALLERNFPMIHAVGRASPRVARLVELRWGARTTPASRLSARAWPLTQAGSTSNPTRPWPS